MSIKLTTNCEECVHKKICRYKHSAKEDMRKLSDMVYGYDSNMDHTWGTLMEIRNVDITFSCSDFKMKEPVVRMDASGLTIKRGVE